MIDDLTAEQIVLQNEKHFAENKYGLWKIKIPGRSQVIGYTGLWYFFDEPQPQLLYALLPAFTKQGFAREAAAAVIRYALDSLGFSYLLAATDEAHIESQKVAESLGMEYFEKRTEEGKPTKFYRIQKPIALGNS